MEHYVVLLRGINVGGKNKLPMTGLKNYLVKLGYKNVRTYIASGNVIVSSTKSSRDIKHEIESTLPVHFKLDSELVKALVLSADQLKSIIVHKPKGFGDQPDKFHSDAIFLIGINASEAISIFKTREAVDKLWAGEGVIYFQRLSSERTKSRLSSIIGTPAYKSMTIRNWNTTTKLLVLLEERN